MITEDKVYAVKRFKASQNKYTSKDIIVEKIVKRILQNDLIHYRVLGETRIRKVSENVFNSMLGK